jgi:hypothetical protein
MIDGVKRSWRLVAMVLPCCAALVSSMALAEGSSSQHRAAEEYLAAVASGDARTLALTIHESELDLLRKRILGDLQLEADRKENLLRGRLFGTGMPLSDIERLTVQNFFATLAARLRFGARVFDRVDWIAVVPDGGGLVHMVGRGRLPKDHGTVRVPVLVSLVPWGKDWKAALPFELQAQLDDLMTGRTRAPGAAAPATGAATPNKDAPPGNPQAILTLLSDAEKSLVAVHCGDYYGSQMSPNFRRTTASKALRALVTSCENRSDLRERLITALRLARGLAPRYEYAGTRAVFDLRGNGLPFDQLVLEQIDKRWYIAE